MSTNSLCHGGFLIRRVQYEISMLATVVQVHQVSLVERIGTDRNCHLLLGVCLTNLTIEIFVFCWLHLQILFNCLDDVSIYEGHSTDILAICLQFYNAWIARKKDGLTLSYG